MFHNILFLFVIFGWNHTVSTANQNKIRQLNCLLHCASSVGGFWARTNTRNYYFQHFHFDQNDRIRTNTNTSTNSLVHEQTKEEYLKILPPIFEVQYIVIARVNVHYTFLNVKLIVKHEIRQIIYKYRAAQCIFTCKQIACCPWRWCHFQNKNKRVRYVQLDLYSIQRLAI